MYFLGKWPCQKKKKKKKKKWRKEFVTWWKRITQETPTFIQTDTHSFLWAHRPDCEKQLGCRESKCGIAANHFSCFTAKPQSMHCVVASPQRAFGWAPPCIRHLAARYCCTYSRSARPPQQAVLVHREQRNVQQTSQRLFSAATWSEAQRGRQFPSLILQKKNLFTQQDEENIEMLRTLWRSSINCPSSLGLCFTTSSHC